ncbi:F0F1 ATP synthase subunit delta [Clostridiaceae bacterium 68-1-5]|uniref:F0F1 ATP synthase subunit delta n=1 Tax=Suipraeoptans intestinalis TaxID=2606628 RepID=A0A6N7V424_9FIRM|nr:F0F1 ATP synthase subunit delta [Suipraeoptans intestinalis]MSR94870.1 F0F1 ATP synthase subunit delta [Suipraeoptans intestinalis]
MRRNGKISPYVKALWELGIEETDLEDIREILRENPKLKKVLEDPRVSRQDKSRWLTECFRRLIKGCCKLW